MATVNLINVGKNYGPQVILDNISLTIDKGEFVAVVGPSGCGKSTLLRLVAGLDTVTQGQILINDECVNKIHPSRRDMAMVFQSYALYPHMTVFQNMAYGLKMRGLKPAQIASQVQETAALLQLTEYLHRKPRELSGGQRQRVAMGRAIVRSPSVFLFDEPLSNLDAKLRTEMRHEIRKLHQQLKTTCLYVTHDQTEAMSMASRVLVLNKGRVEQIADPRQLYLQPASVFVAGFTGQYPINLLPGVIDNANQRVNMECGVSFPLPAMGDALPCKEPVIVGIRPEHLELTTQETSDSIAVRIEFVDNMGMDKLVHVKSLCGKMSLAIRASSSKEISTEKAAVTLLINQANLYHKKTGKRLGGWHE